MIRTPFNAVFHKLPRILPGALVLALIASSAFAGVDMTIFGPKRYDRPKGAPSSYADTFERCEPSDRALIRVTIRLDVGALSGSGSIRANGGAGGTTGDDGSGGGGGRIALYYTTSTLPASNITASGGKGGDGATILRNGGAGTVYLKDSAKAYADLTIDNRGLDSRENSTVLKSLGRRVVSIINNNSLVDAGASWTPDAFTGMKVNPNVTQPQFFTVTNNTADTIFTNPAGGYLNSVAAVGDTYSGVFALNNLRLLGKARVYCNEQFNIASELLADDAILATNEVYAGKTTLLNGGLLSQLPAP